MTIIKEDKEFGNLKESSILCVVQAFSGQAARFVLTIIYAGILVGLLTHREYGLFLIALSLGEFIFKFRDLRLISATVHSQIL